VVLCVGYLGEKIEDAVRDGSQFGLDIRCSYDEAPGTAAALRTALPLLDDEFLVLYGDTYLRIDYSDVADAFRSASLQALMTVLPWPTGGNALYEDGLVRRYEKAAPDPALRWIDYGLGAFRAEAVAASRHSELPELQHDLAERGLLAGYPAHERFYEIGTEQALRETDAFLRSLTGGPA
jgi:NDP-sugar pyrophosphorylase family protein